MNSASRTVRVARIVDEAVDIRTYELVARDGQALPSFSAGSHIDVQVPGNAARQYSLCNDPLETHRYLIGVLRDAGGRGGSLAMHDRVREGDLLEISTPKNHFALAHDAKRSLLLAGGIGITPILCMAERLANIGADFEMHYCTRSRERTAFLGRTAAPPLAPRVRFHFDDGPRAQALDMSSLLAEPGPGAHLYVCGPEGFIAAALRNARARGWLEAQLHCEFFAAAPAASADDVEFQVKLASSGRLIGVPRDWTVVRALAAADVHIPVSCEQGVCGTCLTRVIEGEPDHRDLVLTSDEQARNDQFLPCCSRSKSAVLVLDL
ncbi:MAG TPA: PDR/VanB family oxidoreductase [Caldimonas sp.]|jgi:vanillate O-demethylase ferredoxin subunit|nr:PDR/VanB family oxidoreductase [Caldimonas sp.]